MSLLRHHLLAELEELDSNGARLSLIGDWRALKPDVVERLDHSVQRHGEILARIVAEWVALEPQRNPLSAVPGTR
jgi:hypothetical protein